MNNQSQIIAKIKDSENILITVGSNPSVDELTACLGLALAIDKLKKHTIAIFSGLIPPIMSFLNPEKTFEDSTAGFADFIISLDKSKADKLRYRVEGDLVKIFITPYHTTISPVDLTFSEGDLNVDMLIALGVRDKDDIDKAAYAHGKILHSASITTINVGQPSSFGTINYLSEASSYSETVASIIENIDTKIFSKSIATALLTGIVVETGQFSNEKTTPSTMSMASKLLSYGADQQLIVREIKSGGSVINSRENIDQDIPLKTETKVMPQPAPIQVVDKKPAEPINTLADYMPPAVPDFASGLPALPSIKTKEETDKKNEEKTKLEDQPVVNPSTDTKLKPYLVSEPNSPSQFRIPNN
ncbi:hypothetical protein LJC64_05080 [Ruminococcaceae bacterium OttesenSCG-928-A11]|nr:hypothetical protein [Ruminococcaceae bacterium OttesenSCG-928-A11]